MDWEKAFRDLAANISVSRTQWQFVTSTGVEVTVGTPVVRLSYAATAGALWVREGKAGRKIRLTYGAIGGGYGVNLVPSPINASFSIPAMPSTGTVYRLPAAGKQLTLNEMKGAFMMVEAGLDWSVGRAGGVMFLGGDYQLAAMTGPMFTLALIATSKACVSFCGMNVSALPVNIGANSYLGLIS
jgi:hypothetical protein